MPDATSSPVCEYFPSQYAIVLDATCQQQVLERLATSSVPSTALQDRHSYQLCQQVVDPQTNAVLTSGIRASLAITNDERNPCVLTDRVGVVLFQLRPGALSSAGWVQSIPEPPNDLA